MTEPALITVAEITMDQGSSVIREKSGLKIDFEMPIPLNAGCIIAVSVPSDFKGLYHLVETVRLEGMFGFIRHVPFSLLSNNVIVIEDACLDYTDNSIANATINVQYVQNPEVVADTQSFKILVYDRLKNVIAASEDPLIVNATEFTPGQFESFKITATNPTVQEESSILVTMQSTTKLSQDARIVLLIPKEVSLSSTCETDVFTTVSMRNNIECAIDLRENRITLSDLFYSFGYDPKLEKVIKFQLNDVIVRNPSSLIENLNFTANTQEVNPIDGKYATLDQANEVFPGFNEPG